MSIDFPQTTDPPASACSLQNGFIESNKHIQPDHAYSNGIQTASGDFKYDDALKFGNTSSTTIKMGNFGSKKKKRLAKDAPEEDVWKKKEDVEESNRDGKQKGKKKKKRKKEKNKSKSLENTQTTQGINHDSLTHQTENRLNKSPHLTSSPHRSRKFVKDIMSQRGIKMADESSSSSQGCGTPIPTPPTRRAHPVFKVTTPPPPRRTIDNTNNKISSPTLQRVRHQGCSDNCTVPSPPSRRTNLCTNTDDQCAPELPPRRSRCSKLTSPVLSRKIDDQSSTKIASPVLNRKVNESCNKSGSPRIVRQGSGKTKSNREEEDRAPTPPPRKSSVSSKSSSPKVGSPSVRRAYPVFKVDTPPPARRDYNVNQSSDTKQDKILKGKDHALNDRNIITTKPPQELVYACIDKGSAHGTSSTTQRDVRDNNATVNGDTTNTVELRKKDTIQNVTPRVVITPYRNSMILEQGKPITLSIEADEENYRNIMKENSNKCESRSDATMSVLPGPIVAVKSTIPPPERAVISNVPPPSPSSIDIVEENEEDLLDSYESGTKNKEIEQFGEIVSRRLSMLLESKDIMYEESEFSDSNESCSESRLECSGNKGTDICNYQDLADYDWVEPIGGTFCLSESNKSVCDRSLKSIKTPEGYHKATSLDLENNNYSHEKIDQISNKAPDLLTSSQSDVGSKIATTCLYKDKTRKDDKYFEAENCPRKIRSFDYKDYARDLTPRKRYTKDVSSVSGEVSSTAKSVGRNTIDDEYPVFEDKIIPTSVKRKSLLDELEYKRESDVICDVISSYATPEEEEKMLTPELKSDIESVSQEAVVSKQNINLQQNMDKSTESKQPSRLDQSLQKIFKMPVVDDTYSKLLPVEAFLEDVMESDVMPVPASYPTFNIEDTIRIRRQITGRHSVTRTESDLDISEHMGDDSSDSMLADDEDELGSGEIIFSRTYPDSKHTPGHLVSSTLKDRTFHDDYSDDNIWDDDEDEDEMDERSHKYGNPSIGDCPDIIDFSSSFYSCAAPVDAGDVAFDSARRQMQEIHSHLQNLRQQMENLADKAEGSNLRPSLCLDRRSKAVSD